MNNRRFIASPDRTEAGPLTRGPRRRLCPRASLIALCVALALTAAAEPPAASQPAATPAAAAPADFTGAWHTTFGPMQCTQAGDRVTGTYQSDGTALIDGRVSARRLTFRYHEGRIHGEGHFELAPDGQSFTGQWRQDGDEEWSEWTGTRSGAAAAAAPAGFAGLWTTTFGPMRLTVTGDEIRGTYAFAFAFSYSQPDGETGAGRFELGLDGRTFSGTWKAATGAEGEWTGVRTEPVPGRVWLVILESHWESSLAAPEYSYGHMLRAFFTRVPHVEVRHRFVHSLADFRRWSAEAAYFAEPVVLYVSSHGTAEGALIGSDVVGATELVDCLKHIDDLRLLHFGACEVMGGDIPQQIAAARGPGQTRFPISGFTRTADWAGSAIVDFTYMELVLARGMPPAEAAEQTRKLIKFADEDGTTVIPGSGLKLFAPDESRDAASTLSVAGS